VCWLVSERGAAVTFLSTCQGVQGYGFDDSKVASEIVARIAPELRANVTVDTRRHSHEELFQALAETDLVIATRMHMAILALCAGAVVLPIAYEFKTEELFANLGFADWMERIDDTTSNSLTQRVQHVLSQAGPRRAELSRAVLEQRRLALDADGAMAAALSAHAAESPEGWMWLRVPSEQGWD
jgi:colanic acid/amylovoran biosynthesis protein